MFNLALLITSSLVFNRYTHTFLSNQSSTVDMKYRQPPWVCVLEGPQRSEWTYYMGLLVVCLPCPNCTIFDFPIAQYSQNSSPCICSPQRSPCFDNSTHHLSLTWPSLICHILVLFCVSWTIADLPTAVFSCRTYKEFTLTPFMTINDPLSTFGKPFSDLNV